MVVIKVSYPHEVPSTFTGCVQYFYEHRCSANNTYLPDCEEYYFLGKLHRIDGPAVIYSDGEKGWFLYGKQVTPQEVFDLAMKSVDEITQIKIIWNMDQWK